MGMDAKVDIWVGYNAEVLNELPDEFREKLSLEGEIKVDDIVIRDFYGGDEPVGVGVQLLHHDWDYGTEEVDLGELAEKAAKLKPKIAQIFKPWGISDEPRVLIDTDFS